MESLLGYPPAGKCQQRKLRVRVVSCRFVWMIAALAVFVQGCSSIAIDFAIRGSLYDFVALLQMVNVLGAQMLES